MGRIILALAAALLTSACAVVVPFNTAPSRAGSTTLAQLDGTLAYRERIALPPDAVIMVSLVEGATPDAPMIATTRFAAEGRQVPLRFALSYDPARILPGRRYGLVARVEDKDARLLWQTPTPFPLSFAGEPIDLILARTAP